MELNFSLDLIEFGRKSIRNRGMLVIIDISNLLDLTDIEPGREMQSEEDSRVELGKDSHC